MLNNIRRAGVLRKLAAASPLTKHADAARRYLMRKLMASGEEGVSAAKAVASTDPYMSKAIAALPKDTVTGNSTSFSKYMRSGYPADSAMRQDAQATSHYARMSALSPRRSNNKQQVLEEALLRAQDREVLSGRHLLRLSPPDPSKLPAGAEYINPKGFITHNMPKQGVLFRGGKGQMGSDGYGYAHVTRHPDVAAGYAASASSATTPGNLHAYRTKGLTRAGETTHLAMKPEDAYADLAGRRARSVQRAGVHVSQSEFTPPTYEDIIKFNPAKPPKPLASWEVVRAGKPTILNSRPKHYKDGELYRTERFTGVRPASVPEYTYAKPVGASPPLSSFMPSR